jgi:hypothetical protein
MSGSLANLPLNDFISTFYGYGNARGQYWFIGMEEGGGDTLEEIEQRVLLWEQRGQHELEDIKAYHLALGISRYFTEPTKSQSTWRQLIRIILSAPNKALSLDTIKQYQREAFGQWAGESCLIELLPLPSPSTTQWLYKAWSLPELQSRESYRATQAPLRAASIREKIAYHKPPYVVFYSVQYKPWWDLIANVPFTKHQSFLTAIGDHTRYVIAPHPVSPGVTNADYEAIGQWLQEA